MSNSVQPHRWQPTRLPFLGFSRQEYWTGLPFPSPGVGCHFLLQCMKVRSESEVTQSCPTFETPWTCSLLGCSIHGIFQARVLEWGAIAFSGFSMQKHRYTINGKHLFLLADAAQHCHTWFPVGALCRLSPNNFCSSPD